MMPFGINLDQIKNRKTEQVVEQQKKKVMANTQQSLANQIVSNSMANNPNATPIQQQPANN